MSHLAIDYGTRKTGFAIELQGIALPLEIIETKKIFAYIPKLVRERNINTIVTGIALNMDGTESEQSVRTLDFLGKLKPLLPKETKYVEWDERLSTFEAKSSLGKLGTKSVRDHIDDVAASIFLQSYLDSLGK